MKLFSRDLRLLLAVLDAYRKRYVLGCLYMSLTDVGQLGVPWLVGHVVDRLAKHTIDARGVIGYALAIGGMSLLVAVARFGWRAYIFGTARYVDRDLRNRLYEHLGKLSLDFHLKHKVGDLMALATNDIQAIRAVSSEGVMAGWDAFGMAIGAAVMVVGTVDWRLGAAALSPLLLIGPTTYALGNRIHTSYERVQANFATISDRAQEAFAGVRVVKGFAREDHQAEGFAQANNEYQQAYAAMSRYDVAFDPLVAGLAGLAFTIGLWYGGWLVLQGQLSVGQYVAFNSYLGMLSWPMLAVSWTTNLVQRGTASMSRLQAIFDQQPTVFDGPAARPLDQPRGHISLRGLEFRYAPELPLALEGIDLEAPPGSTIGLMGGTGAGKTTLANLLVRLFNPPPGQIFFDGVDVNDLQVASLRQAVAYVPQDGFLFSRTITRNVAFEPTPHDDAEVREAARRAQLDADVLSFPHGYDTMLGERGVTLSGGQRQRVGIARALLKDAPVLVLDDCLSAVDAETEARLLAELKSAMAGRTTIVISHRTATLAHCDEILVLSDGRVVERGDHAALVAAGQEYARVHRRQQLEAALEVM